MIRVFEANQGFYVCAGEQVLYVTRDEGLAQLTNTTLERVQRDWGHYEMTLEQFRKKVPGPVFHHFHPKSML